MGAADRPATFVIDRANEQGPGYFIYASALWLGLMLISICSHIDRYRMAG